MTPNREPPTIEAVLQRFLERDDEHHSAWQSVTSTQRDQGRLLEAIQVDLQRLTRLSEKQDGINERQIAMQETTATHGRTFDRAFSEIKQISLTLERLVEKWEGTNHHVTRFRGALWGLGLGGALIVGLITTIAVTKDNNRAEDITELKNDHKADASEFRIKMDAAIGQIQELRIARERDIEMRNRETADGK